MNALPMSTISAVDSYWSDYFACPTTTFAQAVTLVVAHAGLGDYHGIFFWCRNDALVISVPPAAHALYAAHLAGLTAAAFDDEVALTEPIPAAISRVIGPAWVGYADAATFRPHQRGAPLDASG